LWFPSRKITREEFERKGYFVVPFPEDYQPTPAFRWFSEGRECDTPDPGNPYRGTEKAKELATPSGKIEFVSQSLKEHFPDDEERPPMPHYIPSWEGLTSELARKYPLQLLSLTMTNTPPGWEKSRVTAYLKTAITGILCVFIRQMPKHEV